MFVAGRILGFYSETQVLNAIEFELPGLLLGMMIIVSILEPTGFFQYVAVKAGQFSRGDPWRLLLVHVASGYSFTDFLAHSMPIVLAARLLTLIMLRFLFKRELAEKPDDLEAVMNLDAEEALQDRTTIRRGLILLAVSLNP